MKETEAFRALGSADRQVLLHELVTTDGKTTEEELSRKVAARRHQIPPAKISEKKIERAHVRLVHVHLPLLLDLNIIERDDHKVTLTNDERRDQLLEAAEVIETWPPDDLLQRPTP